jgi:hypothetical protein
MGKSLVVLLANVVASEAGARGQTGEGSSVHRFLSVLSKVLASESLAAYSLDIELSRTLEIA